MTETLDGSVDRTDTRDTVATVDQMNREVENQRVIDEEERVHLLDQITTLNGELVQARAETLTAQLRHREEVAIITEKLIDAADQNDMCSTYDAVIESLNKYLTVPLGVRDADQTVQVRGRVVINLDRYVDVQMPYNADLTSPQNRERVHDVLRALGLNWLVQGQPSWEIEIEAVDYE